MNNKIRVELKKKSYDIVIGAGKIAALEEFLQKSNYSKIFVISDDIVVRLHFEKLNKVLQKINHEAHLIQIEHGEKSKNFAVFEAVCEEILENNADRKSLIIAFGGGVVGDLAGFVASVVLRGIDFIQIPTTLLAAVDSSVGGKTAINSSFGKNLVGSFYQPKMVICDLNFLATLDERQFRAGYAEVLKYGLIGDEEFFDYLDENIAQIFAKNEREIEYIIAKSCLAKAQIVAQDEKEQDVRAMLNFGHTFGHIFEVEAEYSDKILHGEAVGIGMLMAAKMSQNLGVLNAQDFEKVKNHIIKAKLNFDLRKIKPHFDQNRLVLHLYKDKKTENKELTFILLDKIGGGFIKKSVKLQDFLTTISDFI